MNPIIVGCIGIVAFLILMFLRMPIIFSFAIIGFCGIWYLRGLESAFLAVQTIPYEVAGSYIWSVMPMFIFMGYLAIETNLAIEFYTGVRKWVGQLRGGIAISVIMGNAGFGAVCGDSLTAGITFTTASLPEMRRYNYADSLTLGSIAAGGGLSVLIPPSIGFVVYGAITNTSIGELFISGIIPGILLTIFYIVVIYIICLRNPKAGPPTPKTRFSEKIKAAPGMWVLIFVFVVMIGGLYLGLFTPTEAGGVGAFVVMFLGLARRKLNWQGLKTALIGAGRNTGMILFIIIGAQIFNLLMVVTKLPYSMAGFINNTTQSPIPFLLIAFAIYLFLGMFMSIVPVILVTLPVLFPVYTSLGGDPITFGVVIVLSSIIGSVTPPYGAMVFVIGGAVKDVPITKIYRGVVPFIIPMIILTLLVIFFPSIATWLPSMMLHLGK